MFQKFKKSQAKILREKPTENISKKEQFFVSLNLVEVEYNDYLKDTEHYIVTEFRDTQFKYIYNFLREHSIIEPYIYKSNEELKKYIVSWFKALALIETTPTLHIKNILKNK